jgi:hypothetical protein
MKGEACRKSITGMSSQQASLAFREFFSRLDLHSREHRLNIFVRFTLPETLLYSVLTMLTSGVIFLTSSIFVILAGLTVIPMLLIILMAKSGRRMKKFARNIRAR